MNAKMAVALLGVVLVAAAACAADYEYVLDFEGVPLGRVQPEKSIVGPGAAKDGHVAVLGAKEFTDQAYGEVADGAGFNGSRGLRIVDQSDELAAYFFFYGHAGSEWKGPVITSGVLRFDICFDELPTVPTFAGRRNFGINISAGGAKVTLGGLGVPPGGMKAKAVKPDFKFEKGQWYRVWMQSDPAALPDQKAGLFSVFIKPADGTDEFKPEHAVITEATYIHNQHDNWGRFLYPPNGLGKGRVTVRYDNFAMWTAKAKLLPVPAVKAAEK